MRLQSALPSIAILRKPAFFASLTALSFEERSFAIVAEEIVCLSENFSSDFLKSGSNTDWCPCCQAANWRRYPLSVMFVKGMSFPFTKSDSLYSLCFLNIAPSLLYFVSLTAPAQRLCTPSQPHNNKNTPPLKTSPP